MFVQPGKVTRATRGSQYLRASFVLVFSVLLRCSFSVLFHRKCLSQLREVSGYLFFQISVFLFLTYFLFVLIQEVMPYGRNQR